MLALWQRLRRESDAATLTPAPARSDFQPRLIGKHLPDVFILEYAMGEMPVFRLAGTRICSHYGIELRKTGFPSLWQESDRTAVQELVNTVSALNIPAQIDHHGRSLGGRINQFETLLLPLKSQSSRHFLLGSSFAIDPAYWLGADPLVQNHLIKIRPVTPELESEVQAQHRSIGGTALASDTGWHNRTLTAPTPAHARQVGHLKIFDGGKI